jgi:hypothetical protein
MEWIKWRQWGVTAHLPAEEALSAKLASEAEKRFRLATPLVEFLNAPLIRPEKRRALLVAGLPR